MTRDIRKLIFLDVDGVLNDLTGSGRYTDKTHLIFSAKSHGREWPIRIPRDVIEPVQLMIEHHEVRWLSTWRHDANNEIAAALGIEPLEVITDGSQGRYVEWKPQAARPAAKAALIREREVIWIEDFYGDIPEAQMPASMQFIDTWGRLRPEHLVGVLDGIG